MQELKKEKRDAAAGEGVNNTSSGVPEGEAIKPLCYLPQYRTYREVEHLELDTVGRNAVTSKPGVSCTVSRWWSLNYF